MVSVSDVEPKLLIEKVAEKLKSMKDVEPPVYAAWVKTGAHAQRTPDNPNWWYVRAASLLRRVYLHSPIGVAKLRKWYGGRKNRGVKPEKHVNAGGKIIRECLQQLETAGLVEHKEKKGRVITKKGQSFLDKTAAEIAPRKEKKVVKKPVVKKEKKAAVKKKEKAALKKGEPAEKAEEKRGTKPAVKRKEEKTAPKKEGEKKETMKEKAKAKKAEETPLKKRVEEEKVEEEEIAVEKKGEKSGNT